MKTEEESGRMKDILGRAKCVCVMRSTGLFILACRGDRKRKPSWRDELGLTLGVRQRRSREQRMEGGPRSRGWKGDCDG